MARIGIGINENVVIAGAAMNDKKRLVLSFKSVTGEAPKSLFDEALTAGVVASGSDKIDLNIFGPLVSKKDDKTDAEKAALVHGDLIKLKNQLTQLLEQYMLVEKITLSSADVQFANTGVTAGTYAARIIDQDVATRIYENICTAFVGLIAPFVNPTSDDAKLRIKLVRQSKEKHYATIPGRYLDSQPWVELMSIPAEQSKVKFSAWEITEGLDKGEAVSQAAAETKAAPAPVEVNPFAPTS